MRTTASLSVGLSLVFVCSLAAHALPRGYEDDFNGCALNSPDEADRKRCCMETFTQCQTQCQKDHANDANESIKCMSGCVWAHESCKNGDKVSIRPTWPGVGGAAVPGLTLEGDRTVPEKGFDLVASRSAVLVELRPEGERSDAACTAFVLACSCPAGAEARGQECRAWLDGGAAACRICARGASTDACKPCPDCRTELLSAQSCKAPDRPAPRRPAGKN